MKKFLTVALSLNFLLLAPPLELVRPALAQTVCPNGVLMPAGQKFCPSVATQCLDGTKINSNMTWQQACADHGGTALRPAALKCSDGSVVPKATVIKGVNAVQAWCAAAAAEVKCSDGSVVPTATVVKGDKAVQSWCAAAVAGTTM